MRSDMLEKDVERYFVEQCRCLGWDTVKVGIMGYPDRLVILPGGRCAWAELKTDMGSASKLQRIQIKKLLEKGHIAGIVYGKSGVDDFLESLKRWS